MGQAKNVQFLHQQLFEGLKQTGVGVICVWK